MSRVMKMGKMKVFLVPMNLERFAVARVAPAAFE